MKVITGANTQAIVEPKLRNLHLNQRNKKLPFSTQTIEFKLSPFCEFDSYLRKSKERNSEKKTEE